MKKLVFFGVIIYLSFFLLSKLQAQCGTYTPTYTAKVYNPSSYYSNTYYDYKVKEIVVPILQPLPFFIDPRISYHYSSGTYLGVPLVQGAPPSYSSHAPSVAPAASQPKAAPTPASAPRVNIDELIDQIERRVKERTTSTTPTVSASIDSNGPPVVPGFVVRVAPAPTPDREPITSSKTSLSILTSRCASCHTGERSKGDFVIFLSRGVLNTNLDRASVLDAIVEGRMPPEPRPKLSESDIKILASEWRAR